MEYLMSYGWAILLVMMVGVAMWYLGVFSFEGLAPTSSGFQTLKPLLATCEMKRVVWLCNPGLCYSGFTCQFLNAYDQDIILLDYDLRVDGKSCKWEEIFRNPNYGNPNPRFRKECFDENGYCTSLVYVDRDLPCPQGITQCFPVKSGGQFSAATISTKDNAGFDIGPCSAIVNGKPYQAELNVTYSVDVGGVTVVKNEYGIVRLSGSSN